MHIEKKIVVKISDWFYVFKQDLGIYK